MTRERRGEARYVVDGLRVAVDDVEHPILDVALTSVRLMRPAGTQPPQAEVDLHLWSDDGFPALDAHGRGTLVRLSPVELVYQFQMPDERWPALLPQFDTFKDLRIPGLED